MIYVIITIAALLVSICAYFMMCKSNMKDSISFLETFNLTEMPIVTFFYGKKKLNFLVDTGSTNSHISKEMSSILEGKEQGIETKIICASPSAESLVSKTVDTSFTHNGKNYDIRLIVNQNLDKSFKIIKKERGITLHGILGTDFLSSHSYVVDFNKYLLYSKK